MQLVFRLRAIAIAAGATGVALPPSVAADQRVLVQADDPAHERALMAIAHTGLRHEFVSSGNELTFSATLTGGQIQAMERLGARLQPVPEVHPMTRQRIYGAFRAPVRASGKPGIVCGNDICEKGENANSCPADCGGGDGDLTGRTCAPRDQREYQTLLLSGAGAGVAAGAGVRLLVIDTGVRRDHPDLAVASCRDVTGRRVKKNSCDDAIGHGTHVAGSAAANGGADGLGLFGAAPGAVLGVQKICTSRCFLDDLIQGIEDGVASFGPDIISLSFSAPEEQTLKNAIQAAVDGGVLFFTSAGNKGPDAGTITYPASDPNTIAVGMLDAARIANRISSRSAEDPESLAADETKVEFAGGGFVVESTASNGCYAVMTGTSMSTPSVAGFAAANWQPGITRQEAADATLDVLVVGTQDIHTALRNDAYGYVDDSGAGFDIVTGHGLPQAGGVDGSIMAKVVVFNKPVLGQDAEIDVTGPPEATFRIGATSPNGNWAYGEYTTDLAGYARVLLTAHTDAGQWLLTVDFGGGKDDFSPAHHSFVYSADVASAN